ncbi:unnamed protein product [Strongylus vulgaris]|uniref:Uncharacterized protein n=1 Tax=Strongylus vulgaris TaxID=40348 RepID=A0A3P7I3T2_STRVU|nr:unnamed protein product [Strongylus vulgaris]
MEKTTKPVDSQRHMWHSSQSLSPKSCIHLLNAQ